MSVLDFMIFAQMQNQPQGPPPGAAAALGGLMICYFVFIFALAGFMIAVYWKIFTKAGEPGWASLVPVYNGMILAKICGRGEMFGLLLLIPCVNIVIAIMLIFDLARVFGKDTGFAIGLLLLGIVFLPILAFGSAQYVGPDGSGGGGGGRRRRSRDYDDDEDDRPRRRRDEDDDDDRGRRDDRVRRPRRDDY